jgi:protein-arginine kinase activator protein McsA
MSEQERLYRKLAKLFTQFQNRPNHLAKFLVDKMAFNDLFIKMLLDSERLDDDKEQTPPTFRDIDEMKEYYDIFKEPKGRKSSKKRAENLISKLEECLRLEKYEDAARIRDYMIKLGIKDENEL